MEYLIIVNTLKDDFKKFLGVSVFLQVFISLRHVSVCDIHPSPTHQGEGGRRQNSLLKITRLDEFSEKAYE